MNLEQKKPLDKTKELILNSGAHVTIHYATGSESLTNKMTAIFSQHISKCAIF